VFEKQYKLFQKNSLETNIPLVIVKFKGIMEHFTTIFVLFRAIPLKSGGGEWESPFNSENQ